MTNMADKLCAEWRATGAADDIRAIPSNRARRAHSTPDPDQPPPDNEPVPDEMPQPEQAPVREPDPIPHQVPIRTA